MSGRVGPFLEELRRELARDEHELSELVVILADYSAEQTRLVKEIGRLQTELREAEEAFSTEIKRNAKSYDGQKT